MELQFQLNSLVARFKWILLKINTRVCISNSENKKEKTYLYKKKKLNEKIPQRVFEKNSFKFGNKFQKFNLPKLLVKVHSVEAYKKDFA